MKHVRYDPETGRYIGPLCHVGQTLYMPTSTIVIPVTVVEVEDIYAADGVFKDAGSCGNGDCSVWMYTSIDGSKRASQGSIETDEHGWPTSVTRDPEEVIKKCVHANQYLWIDEPVGHSVAIYDEVFFTLQEAMCYIRPSNKKHLRRRLKKYRGRVHRFIAHTWNMNGERHPGFTRLPDKKIYVRRG